ncbi:MAG: ATP-binding protein [Microscillaceae bacterium]|nr:ATP-binding protein [Microscillaceae bacterium]MDW8461142.1 ATP-binding protein [Cytophagales bacterium]
MLKVAITGPESTGKSTLCEALAKHFHTVWVEEYARSYLENLPRAYNYTDILHIAQMQMQEYELKKQQANQIIFCDTELLVTKIWAEHAFGKCHAWILANLPKQDFDLYLLTYIDLPWQYDKLREHPHKRDFFWQWYLNEAKNLGWNYEIITGMCKERTQKAIQAIQELANKRGILLNLARDSQ